MKIYLQMAALISGLFFVTTQAMAHSGHMLESAAGHTHTSEYAVIGLICIALISFLAGVAWKHSR